MVCPRLAPLPELSLDLEEVVVLLGGTTSWKILFSFSSVLAP
jgi:hypothetical protein